MLTKEITPLVKKHPNEYTVFQPNILIGANNDLNVAEARLYSEIINFNHREEPDRLNYSIPYDLITHIDDKLEVSRKASQEVLRITQSLQKRTFFLNKEFMGKHFGEKHPISINPFPTIRYEAGCFDIYLNPYFKGLLLRLDLGFTRGDIELLRDFTHEASHRLYWLIRSVQWKLMGNTLEFEIEEFKKSLGCEGAYENRFDNFKKNIINPIQAELRNTWVDFEYDLVKGGKGGKVQKIILKFKSDFELEKLLKLGYTYKWEESLTNHGLNERDILKFRHNVTYLAEIKPGYRWDSFYIQSCIQIAARESAEKQRTKGKTKIKNFGSYLYSGIVEGWWLDEIESRRPANSPPPANQINIFTPEEARPLKKYSFPLADLEALYLDFKSQMKMNISLKDFARQHKYVIVGDRVEKME